MSTFLSKLRVVTLGAVHDLLDKAIDLNSPSALRQYVRDLEGALASMQNNAATQAGECTTLDRELREAKAAIDTKTATIKKIYAGDGPNKEVVARGLGTEVVNLQKRVTDLTAQLATQQQTSKTLDEAVAKVEARHREMVGRIHDLERLDRDSKAKEQSAHSLQAAGAILGSGSDISVDDIEQKMRARNDVASAKLDRALGGLHVEEDPGTASAVDDLLASLKPEPVSK
jgi:phage shock protein A